MSLLSAAAHDEDGDIIQALRAENDALKQQLMAATKSALDHVQRNRDLEALLEAVGAGGVGPLMPRKLTQQDSALLGNIESPFNACMHQEHCKRWKAQADQQHQLKLSSDNDLQRENGHLITSSSTHPQPQRGPLTQAQVIDGFCSTPYEVQCVGAFKDGVRFAERAHGIGGKA